MAVFERPSTRRQRREQAVLNVLAQRPSGTYGLFLWRDSRLPQGVFFRTLHRLVADGRVVAWWVNDWDMAKPRKRYYGLAERPDAEAVSDAAL